MPVKDTYDDDKVPLHATLGGGPSASKIKDVKFVLTLKKKDVETEQPPVTEQVSGFPPKAVHQYTPEKVGDDLDFYDLSFKTEVTPPGKSSTTSPGQDQVRVWPKTVKLTFTSDDGTSHKTA